jgi:hypothetical protein
MYDTSVKKVARCYHDQDQETIISRPLCTERLNMYCGGGVQSVIDLGKTGIEQQELQS